jgi:hypothetical protein
MDATKCDIDQMDLHAYHLERGTLQALNGLRNAAQHHLLDMCEENLYIQAQAGVTLFRDLLRAVFGEELADELPARVLPLSTVAPKDLAAVFSSEVDEVRRLLRPGSRRAVQAQAKLRSLAILDGALQGERLQPGDSDLRALGERLGAGDDWTEVFPGVASLELSANGYGPSLDLRLSKKEGIPVQLVAEGTRVRPSLQSVASTSWGTTASVTRTW